MGNYTRIGIAAILTTCFLVACGTPQPEPKDMTEEASASVAEAKELTAYVSEEKCTLEYAQLLDPSLMRQIESNNKRAERRFNAKKERAEAKLAMVADCTEPTDQKYPHEWSWQVSEAKQAGKAVYMDNGRCRLQKDLYGGSFSKKYMADKPWSMTLAESAIWLNEESGDKTAENLYYMVVGDILQPLPYGQHLRIDNEERKELYRITRDIADSEMALRWAAPWVIETGISLLNENGKMYAGVVLDMFWQASYADMDALEIQVIDNDHYLYDNNKKVEGWFMRRWRAQRRGEAGDQYMVILRSWMTEASWALNQRSAYERIDTVREELRNSGPPSWDYYVNRLNALE